MQEGREAGAVQVMRARGGLPSVRRHQRGITFLGLLFLAIVLVCVGVVVAQVIPTLIEYQAITKAAKKATDGATVPEVRSIFDRAQAIDDFGLTGKDLVVRKVNDKVVVSFAYEREIHLFGPAYLTMKYSGEAQSN